MSQGYIEFEFDLPDALLVALIRVLNGLASMPLDGATARAVPEAQRIYQLFHEGNLVYIGKTDAQLGLRSRLSRHADKLLHRPALHPGDVHFKAVRILVFTAMDLETTLIKHYRASSLPGRVSWNGSGFGSNDPGRERETTNKAPEGFDTQFPVSIDIPGDYIRVGTQTVAEALAQLKGALPYTLRYETLRNARGKAQRGHPHLDLTLSEITISSSTLSVRELLISIVSVLPPGWQATHFVSHVILYKEARTYAHGEIIG